MKNRRWFLDYRMHYAPTHCGRERKSKCEKRTSNVDFLKVCWVIEIRTVGRLQIGFDFVHIRIYRSIERFWRISHSRVWNFQLKFTSAFGNSNKNFYSIRYFYLYWIDCVHRQFPKLALIEDKHGHFTFGGSIFLCNVELIQSDRDRREKETEKKPSNCNKNGNVMNGKIKVRCINQSHTKPSSYNGRRRSFLVKSHFMCAYDIAANKTLTAFDVWSSERQANGHDSSNNHYFDEYVAIEIRIVYKTRQIWKHHTHTQTYNRKCKHMHREQREPKITRERRREARKKRTTRKTNDNQA